jgi:DNA excision repair protein ERCC-4
VNIIIDTREQKPFDMTTASFAGAEFEIVRQKLDCGDYSVEGFEDKIVVERKATPAELYGNLATEKMRERFYREMEKLSKVEEAYILCEFAESCLYTFPKNSGIPIKKQKYLRVGAKYFRKLVYEVAEKFNVEYIFCDNRMEAELKTFELLTQAANR